MDLSTCVSSPMLILETLELTIYTLYRKERSHSSLRLRKIYGVSTTSHRTLKYPRTCGHSNGTCGTKDPTRRWNGNLNPRSLRYYHCAPRWSQPLSMSSAFTKWTLRRSPPNHENLGTRLSKKIHGVARRPREPQSRHFRKSRETESELHAD